MKRPLPLALLLAACPNPTESTEGGGEGGGTADPPGTTADQTDPTGSTGAPPGITPNDWTAPGSCSTPGAYLDEAPGLKEECPPCPPGLGYSACTEMGTCGCSFGHEPYTGPLPDVAWTKDPICEWGSEASFTGPDGDECVGGLWPYPSPHGVPDLYIFPASGPKVCPPEYPDNADFCMSHRPGWVGWGACLDDEFPINENGTREPTDLDDWYWGDCY